MNHNFIAIICFLLAFSSLQGTVLASRSSNPANFRRLYEAVTEEGKITLQKDDIGFFVNVDFAYNPDDASDSEANDADLGAMSLGLYSSETILTESCLQFNDYECSEWDCTLKSERAKLVLPYFIAEGHYAVSPVYLDYENWELNNDAVVATTCTVNTYSPYGSDRYGILGLGFNTTESNFIDGTMFSITLERDASSGILLFESNYNVTESSTFVASLNASSNWHIDASDATIDIDGYTLDFSGKMIFDLDATEIGFPSDLYNMILNDLQLASSELFGCSNDTYQPTCNYNGKIKHLKTISITVQDYTIDIPPTVYVQGYTDGESEVDSSITLNMRALDPTYTGASYVTENYQNYIILDQNFLSYYYVEFVASGEEYTVSLQTLYANSDDDSGDDCPAWVYIVGGVGAFFLLALFTCCVCGCIKRKRDRKRAASKRVFQTDSNVNPSDHIPLVNNDQVPSNLPYPSQNYYPPPVYTYSQNAYNQNGYNQNTGFTENNNGYTGNQYPQFQQPTHAYGNMPGYTYIPQTVQTGAAYPYLPPAPVQQQQQPFVQNDQRNQ